VAVAVVFAAVVPGPGTCHLNVPPESESGAPWFTPFTVRLTAVKSVSWMFPNPASCHCVVPPTQGRLLAPFTVHVTVFWPSANAAEGKIAQAIMMSVAADTAIRPAAVSRRLCVFLRFVGIDPILSSYVPSGSISRELHSR
jgi:hypothetical protein